MARAIGACERESSWRGGLLLALLLACMAPPSARSGESCDTLGGLISLQSAAASGADMAQLSAIARGVDHAAMKRALARMDLEQFGADVSAFLDKAAAGDAAGYDRARLSQIDSLLRMACPQAGSDSGGSASESGRLRMGKRLQAVEVGWVDDPWSPAEVMRNFRLTAQVIAGAIAGFGLLYLAKLGYEWGFAYIYLRHGGEIHATVIYRKAPIHGVIRILGRHGCRFVADEAVDRARLERAPLNAEAAVIIAEHRFAVDIDDAHEDHAVLYFAETLPEDTVRHLLRRSVVPPRLEPKRPPRKGRRARREKRGRAPPAIA